MGVAIAALFGGLLTVLAMEFPYTSITPPTLSYFLTQLVIFSVQIAALYFACILLLGAPCWAALLSRGVSAWWAAMALGAALGLLVGGVLHWALPILLPIESCHAFNTCRVRSPAEEALDVLRFVVICGLILGLTGLVLWRLSRMPTS